MATEGLPVPATNMKKKKLILEKDLIEGHWYLGDGRAHNVAYWSGSHFLYPDKVYTSWITKYSSYGSFIPFEEIDDTKYAKRAGEKWQG